MTWFRVGLRVAGERGGRKQRSKRENSKPQRPCSVIFASIVERSCATLYSLVLVIELKEMLGKRESRCLINFRIDQTTHDLLLNSASLNSTTQLVSDPRMTPRASEGGGSTGLSPSRPLTISKQQPLPTPPSSQSPPDMTELHDKELPDPPNESTGEGEGGKGGILSGEGKATFYSLSKGTAEGRICYRGTAASMECTGSGYDGLTGEAMSSRPAFSRQLRLEDSFKRTRQT